jgi:hypothetical protein
MNVKITRAETMIEDKIPIVMRSRFTYENSSGVMMPDGFRCGRSTPGEGTLGRTNSTRCCVFCLLRRVPVFPTRVFLVIVTFSLLDYCSSWQFFDVSLRDIFFSTATWGK